MRLNIRVLLEFPVPKLLAYPRETVVAEKLEAITVLGVLNSRMKDYFDLMLLSQLYEFDGAVLHRAVRATIQTKRSTEVEPLPIGAFGRLRVGTGKGCAVESISSQEQIRNRLCKSRWRHKISAGFCWTRIDSSCNRRRISVSLEAWRAVGNLGTLILMVGLGGLEPPTSPLSVRPELVFQQPTRPRGLPKYAEIVRDIACCALGCGLEKSTNSVAIHIFVW